ncbi:hypothetical protein M404DRAFT_1005440 [Pisolithus tinctorius Marx 270]|uniref:Uncharacterized protein n=1 Tax=Pisolithus tinctorius Marx 270 TaxID=870435 RepID=A0A0C3IMZ5_PISTI|nr:hypothetical protein M404DRAFT_1005440 [Pisolithus tinctorius Marx 270]
MGIPERIHESNSACRVAPMDISNNLLHLCEPSCRFSKPSQGIEGWNMARGWTVTLSAALLDRPITSQLDFASINITDVHSEAGSREVQSSQARERAPGSITLHR